ncbi:MAG: hypothetical protein R3F47_04020 [Gammaproteobacteria bacterium]
MWQSIQAFHQHPQWGLHVRSLTEESSDLLAGNSLAACISSLDLIRVSGADAETFLQGQTTCDFREVRQGQIRLGAHCNVKGRVQASFYALPQGEDFLLLLPKGQGEPTRAALAKYAMFSKATLSLDTSLWPLALLGPDARRWAARIGGADLEAGKVATGATGLVACLDQQTFLALVPADQASAALQQLHADGATLAGDNVWWLDQLHKGIAQILPAQSEQWIPQEFNYDLVGGISFKKGCYKGQEIVARIHYRGQTKVRAYLLEADATTADAGLNVINASGQTAGNVLQAAFVNDHSLLVLAALKTAAAESESLRLEPNESTNLRLIPMPYAITN